MKPNGTNKVLWGGQEREISACGRQRLRGEYRGAVVLVVGA